ncbi:MAG: copper amine oxidase N-terminal domain-containing protein [Oscillospiraceae bacterium]|nr:copper amine oxidase N-terminal domain-containing protein [Oscillospiraceae bacterium]
MRKMKNAVLVIAGILAGIAISSPAAQAAASLMANPCGQQFYVNGQKVNLQAYEINGSSYVKLQDIGQALDFEITYDAAANSVHISPDSHTAEASTEDARLTNGKPVTEENVLEFLRQIEKDWPVGSTWNEKTRNEVPSTEASRITANYPVNSVYGCGGYAAMVSSLIFGDTGNPGHKLDDLSQIRPGDIIFRINNKTGAVWHVTVALESPNEINAYHVTDGNCGGTVHWPERPDQYDRENLDCYRGENKSHHLEVWTRYPESVPYTGNSVNAWPASAGN